jgi:hypothetical protein
MPILRLPYCGHSVFDLLQKISSLITGEAVWPNGFVRKRSDSRDVG